MISLFTSQCLQPAASVIPSTRLQVFGTCSQFRSFFLPVVKRYYNYKHHCDHDVTLGGHAPYGGCHVVPSAVSLAGMYTLPAKRVSVTRSQGLAKPGFLPISAGKASWTVILKILSGIFLLEQCHPEECTETV